MSDQKLTVKNSKAFMDQFLENYLKMGMGSLGKREIDILVMHLLLEHTSLSSMPQHQMSQTLRLTESRVRSLRYEARLKYTEWSDEQFRSEFFSLMSVSQFAVDQGQVCIPVEDTYLRYQIQGRLKALGSFGDSSFNVEVLKIRLDAFAKLLNSLYTPEEIKKFEKEIKKVANADQPSKFDRAVAAFIEGAASQAGTKVVDLTAIGLTGGASEIPGLISAVKGFFGR